MSASSPRISILVPAYNAAPYLTALCDSIRAQTHTDFEVLILNDGSTDNTDEVLAPCRKDARFKISGWSPNRGVHAATSALLCEMKGKYWCNPGADDVLSPHFLAKRLKVLESHPEAVMVHGPAEFIDAAGNAAQVDFPDLKLPASMGGGRALSVLLQHNVISTTSVLVRSEITRRVLPWFQGGWKYAQDWYLWLLHAATGLDLLWDNEILFKYRVHECSLSGMPAHAATRRAETRLVPLCALNAAAQYSPPTADLWSKWHMTLYRLWLFRAARLRAGGQLQPEWLRLARHACHGRNNRGVSLLRELCIHGWGIPLTVLKEWRATRQQAFRVSGIAQINDPVFR